MNSLTISLIYIGKDSNTGLLIIIDQQFLLFMNRYRENLQENISDCVLCLREFVIADTHNQNTVSFGMSKQ